MIITVDTIKKSYGILVEISYPNNPVKQCATVANEEALNRLLYFHERTYIVDKLYSWLNQRKKALTYSSESSKLMTVSKLQVLISYHRDTSLHNLCAVINEHREFFNAVAPGEFSMHSKYYGSTILPILNTCESYGK